MSKARKFLTILTMVAVTTTVSLTAVSSAQASHRHHHRAGDVALGALGGLVAGAIIGSSRREAYPAPAVRRASRSTAHIDWCDRRYRSYNIYTDTFTGYDRRQHYCNSPYVY